MPCIPEENDGEAKEQQSKAGVEQSNPPEPGLQQPVHLFVKLMGEEPFVRLLCEQIYGEKFLYWRDRKKGNKHI